MKAGWFAAQVVIEARDAVYVGERQIEVLRRSGNTVVRHVTDAALHLEQCGQQRLCIRRYAARLRG